MEYIFGNNEPNQKRMDSISSKDAKTLLDRKIANISNLAGEGIIINFPCPKSSWSIKDFVITIEIFEKSSCEGETPKMSGEATRVNNGNTIKSYFCLSCVDEIIFYMTTGHTFILGYDKNNDEIIITDLANRKHRISKKYELIK